MPLSSRRSTNSKLGADIKEQVISIIILRKDTSIKYKTTDYIKDCCVMFSFFCTLKRSHTEMAFTKASFWLGTLPAHGLIWRPESRGLQGPGCHSCSQGTSGSSGSHSVRSPGGEEYGSQIFAEENDDHLKSFTLKSLGSNHPLLLQTRGCGLDTLRNGSKNKCSGHLLCS